MHRHEHIIGTQSNYPILWVRPTERSIKNPDFIVNLLHRLKSKGRCRCAKYFCDHAVRHESMKMFQPFHQN